MIHTSTQLKALIRNESHGDNAKAATLIRNFVMERFLERMSLSKYRENLILKGGMLHNLPRVYLGKDRETLCGLMQEAISEQDAIEYAFDNMNTDMKKKYQHLRPLT